ncbi:MAG: D-alanyl-D-alanine carboxypeptidase [Saprospiraceae bacterium]|nr:D-alanyl-D-alanine carboxypeptidase [Saprospiraceae bacterium]
MKDERTGGHAVLRSNLSKYLFLLCCMWIYSGVAAQKLTAGEHRKLEQLIDKSPVFSKMFTGFALFDPETSQILCQRNGDRYFTPASNTKIFTFYTALKILGDSLPALHYITRGDSLIFWGAGHPAFLHAELTADSTVFLLLQQHKGKLFFCADNFLDDRFGPGWAWDDYRDYYQPERSPLPIYGNVVRYKKNGSALPQAMPELFNPMTTHDSRLPNDEVRFVRQEYDNVFTYNNLALNERYYNKEAPFYATPAWVVKLLSDTLKRGVALLDHYPFPLKGVKTLYLRANDALYRKLMQESDNFIAEQLLLMCADKLSGALRADNAIAYARYNLFRDLPDELIWNDGSGLSRYNLFTPRSIVKALHKLYLEVPQDRLFSIMAAGGATGTIRGWYNGKEGPYVYAKTGTLRNVHCLSGFLCTQSGRILIFSFMHNAFIGGPTPVKEEMAKVLQWIWEHY